VQPIILRLPYRAKGRLKEKVRKTPDAGLRDRYRIVLGLAQGRSAQTVAEGLEIHPSTVRRVAKRFLDLGEEGLRDRREDNGKRKVDATFVAELEVLVRGGPPDFGERRPTWTRELLVQKMAERTGVKVSVRTLARALELLEARWGRPRPVVGCPLSEKTRGRRLRQLRRLIRTLPPDEVCLYEDEVDIHLNPKIGPDWMLPGQQKEVVTPGRNVKRYVAGALNPKTGRVVQVSGERKTGELFLALLRKLLRCYGRYKRIHLIVDNYCIHQSKPVREFLRLLRGRIVLHFLPPYCPNENKIERLWRDLHAAVTRNHQCRTIEELMEKVFAYLEWRTNRRRAACVLPKAA